MKKKFTTMMSIGLTSALLVSACSSGGNAVDSKPSAQQPAKEEKKELNPVELTWYMVGNPQTDIASIEQAVNEYMKPKINASLKIQMVPGGSYAERMNTLLASGESFDMLWTANWTFIYETNAKKGAFMDLTDMLPKVAPKLQASLPKLAWDDSKLQGKLYAVPNYQVAAKVYGFVIQKKYVDKYNLNVGSLKTFKDLEPFLEKIKQNEPGVVPFSSTENFRHQMHGYTGVNDVTIYKQGDKDYKVVELADTPEYMEFHKMLHDWFKKGYINKDIATGDNAQLLKSGKIAAKFDQTLKPGGEVEEKGKNGGNDVVYIKLSKPEFTGFQPTMTAISRTSKNPERALMFLELVHTDSTLFNLLAYGIEGKHHEKVGPNTVKRIPNSGYSYANWRLGNVTKGYLLEGQAENTWAETIKMNEEAQVPEIFGFQFNSEPVKAEMANVAAVRKEFKLAIESGAVDPEVYIPRYRDALKKSGNDKILAEHQKQLDAWLKEKGKK